MRKYASMFENTSDAFDSLSSLAIWHTFRMPLAVRSRQQNDSRVCVWSSSGGGSISSKISVSVGAMKRKWLTLKWKQQQRRVEQRNVEQKRQQQLK